MKTLLCLLALTTALHAAKSFVPNIGPDLPTITVTCGEVSLLLRQASQWTPGRIDFRGHAMTTERSADGTVFSFPDWLHRHGASRKRAGAARITRLHP